MRVKAFKRVTCLLLVFLFCASLVPDLGLLAAPARAATNVDNGFEGQDADVFSALGFDTAKLPEGFDPDTTDNPYGRDKLTGNLVSELLAANFVAYALYGHGNNNVTVDQVRVGSEKYKTMPTEVAALRAGVQGDFDGDGLAGEVAYVGFAGADLNAGTAKQLSLCLFDPGSSTYSNVKNLGASTPSYTIGNDNDEPVNQYATLDRWQNLLQITSGDYDGDGTSEIAVYVTGLGGARVDVYRYQKTSQSGPDSWRDMNNWAKAWSYAVSAEKQPVPNMVSLCSGDFNRDGIDDLAISYGSALYTNRVFWNQIGPLTTLSLKESQAKVLWGSPTEMLRQLSPLDLGKDHDKLGSLIRVSLTYGDLNEDGTPELIMTGQPTGDAGDNKKRAVASYVYGEEAGLVIDMAETISIVDGSYTTVTVDDNTTTQYNSNNGYDDTYRSDPIMRTNSAVILPEGGEGTCLYVDSAMVRYQEGSLSLAYELDDTNYNTESGKLADWPTDSYSEYGAVSGDINGLGYDILSTSFFMNTFKLTVPTSTPLAATVGGNGSGGLVAQSYGASVPITFTMPDTDLDTTLIEYSGYHYLTYSDPQVLAIIAAAPYFEDVDVISDYDYAWQNTTSYSQISGSGESSIVALDFEIGGYLSSEVTAGGAKIEAETSLGFTLEWEKETTKSYEYTLSFETSQDEDAVAFYSIPTENYLFYVSVPDGSGGYTTTPSIISNTFAPCYQVLSLEYYESIQGNYDELPQVMGTALTSSPGDPSSYPSSDSGYDVIAKWNDDPAGVSFGNGAITQEITITEEQSETYNLGGVWDFKIGGGVGLQSDLVQSEASITGGLQWSLNPSKGWSNINLTGSSFSGTVTNMPAQFSDYGYYYNWKLFVYNYEFANGNSIPVVSYLVGDVSQPPKLPGDFQQDYERSASDANVLTWTYGESAKAFHIYKYYHFPVGSGPEKIATINPADPNSYIIKLDENNQPYKEYYFTDSNLAPYTEYEYSIQVERYPKIPPLSAPSGILKARTTAASGYPELLILESDNKNDGALLAYPDKTSSLTAVVTGPDGAATGSYYTTVQYQWEKLVSGAWTELVGKTTSKLSFEQAGVETQGDYRCRVNVQTKADALNITAYTNPVTLTHDKRTSYLSDLKVTDVQGGGVNLYAMVKNAHADSGTIPGGFITFTLTSSLTLESYQFFVPLGATGAANKVVEASLPAGMYTVNAYYSGSFIFKACTASGQYLSQMSSGYLVDAPAETVYGDGATLTFQQLNKALGVTTVLNTPAENATLTLGIIPMRGKTSGTQALPLNGNVTQGGLYYFSVEDGSLRSFTAYKAGKVNTAGGYVTYEGDDFSSYLTRLEGVGKFQLEKNTPAGTYIIKIQDAQGSAAFAPIKVLHKQISLRLPSLSEAENSATIVPQPTLGSLPVQLGGWAECDLVGGTLDSTLAGKTVPVNFINTAGQVFTNESVADFCGYYTISHPATTTIATNYAITFVDGSITITGAMNPLYVGAREFFGLDVGAVSVISPKFDSTRGKITTTGGQVDPGVLTQQHAAGTRVVLMASPDLGYEVDDWYINGVSQGKSTTSLVHVMLSEATKIEVQFKVAPNTLSFSTVGNSGSGTIRCNDQNLTSGSLVLANAKFTFTAQALEGYHFKEWRYTQLGKGTIYDTTDAGKMTSTFDLVMPGASCSVYAVFERDFYTFSFRDLSGNDGLVAWYHGSRTTDGTAHQERISLKSGDLVMGDTQIVVEPASGCSLEDGFGYLSVGTQGVADYTLGTYTLAIKENTTVSTSTTRGLFPLTLDFDVSSTTVAPVDAQITYSVGDAEDSFSYSAGDSQKILSDLPGGSPIYAQVSHPDYYDLVGWQYSGTCFITAKTEKDPLAVPLKTSGAAVTKGAVYSYAVTEAGDTKYYYFTATETGTAIWDGDQVTLTAKGDNYFIPALKSSGTLKVILKEKPTHTVTLKDGTVYSYRYTLPAGALESVTVPKVITVHEGDSFTLTVEPLLQYAVTHWKTTPEGGATITTSATSLSFTLPNIRENYHVEPVTASSTYNIIDWPGIKDRINKLTLSPLDGYQSQVTVGGSFSFRLSGASLPMVDKVFANGQEFLPGEGNQVSGTTYRLETDPHTNMITYTIENIKANQTISLTLKTLGIKVGDTDISALSGTGWNYDSAFQTLYLRADGLALSGANDQDIAPNFRIVMEGSISASMENLKLLTTAPYPFRSDSADLVTLTASGENEITLTSPDLPDDMALMYFAGGLCLRGSGALTLTATNTDRINAAYGIHTGKGETLITGNVALDILLKPNASNMAGIFGQSLIIGADNSLPNQLQSQPKVKISVQYASAVGVYTFLCDLLSGSLLIDSEGYGINTGRDGNNWVNTGYRGLRHYDGIMEIQAAETAFFEPDSYQNFKQWRVYQKEGYQLRYKTVKNSILTVTKQFPDQYSNKQPGPAYDRIQPFIDFWYPPQFIPDPYTYVYLAPATGQSGEGTLLVKTNSPDYNSIYSIPLTPPVVDVDHYYILLEGSMPGGQTAYYMEIASEPDLFDHLSRDATDTVLAKWDKDTQTFIAGAFTPKTVTLQELPELIEALVLEPKEDMLLDIALTGTWKKGDSPQEPILDVTDPCIQSITLDGFTFPSLILSDVPVYLDGVSTLSAETRIPLIASAGLVSLYGLESTLVGENPPLRSPFARSTDDDTPGSLQVVQGDPTGYYSTMQTLAAESSVLQFKLYHPGALMLQGKGTTVIDADGVLTTYEADFYSRTLTDGGESKRSVAGQYGRVWTMETGTSAFLATTPGAFDGTGHPYIKISPHTASAKADPSALSYDKGTGQGQLSTVLSEPTKDGILRAFASADTVKLSSPTGVITPLEAGTAYTLEDHTLTLAEDLVKGLAVGKHKVQVHFYDERPEDATVYLLEISLVIANTEVSKGELRISPETITLGRSGTYTFTTEFTGTTPKHYTWKLEGASSPETTLTPSQSGSSAVLVIGPQEATAGSLSVKASSFLEVSSTEPLGEAEATVTLCPLAAGIVITCVDETPSGDGSFTLRQSSPGNQAKTWDFNAEVTLDSGEKAANVTWSLQHMQMQATTVSKTDGLVTVSPKEIGKEGQMLLTATYTNGDGTTLQKTVPLYLFSDAHVSFTQAGVMGNITGAVYGPEKTPILPAGSWIPAGSTVTVTAAPDPDCMVKTWYVGGKSVMADSKFTVNEEASTLTFQAAERSFYAITADYINKNSFSVQFEAGDHGSLTAKHKGANFLSGSRVIKGDSLTLTAQPGENASVKHWLLNGDIYQESGVVYKGSTLTLSDIQMDYQVSIVFESEPLELTMVAGLLAPGDAAPNGSLSYLNGETPMSPAGTPTVGVGVTYTDTVHAWDHITVIAAPDAGYQVKAWHLWDGSGYQALAATGEKLTYSAPSLTEALRVMVTFEPIPIYTVTVSADSAENGNGRALSGGQFVAQSQAEAFQVLRHGSMTVYAIPDPGSQLMLWRVTNEQDGTNVDCTAEEGTNAIHLQDIKGNVKVAPVFQKLRHDVTVETVSNATVSADCVLPGTQALVTVTEGETQEVKSGCTVTVTLTPDYGCALRTLTVNGEEITPLYDSKLGAYVVILTNLSEDITIDASFDDADIFTVTGPADYAFAPDGTVMPGFVPDGTSDDADPTDAMVEILHGGSALLTFTPEDGVLVDVGILEEELETVLDAAGSDADYLITVEGGSYVASLNGVDMDLDFSAMANPFVSLEAELVVVSLATTGEGSLVVTYLGATLTDGAQVPAGADLSIEAIPDAHHEVIGLQAGGNDLGSLPGGVNESVADGCTADDDITIEATFQQAEFRVMLNILGSGTGTLTAEAGRTTLVETGYLPKDAAVSVSATPGQNTKLGALVIDGIEESDGTGSIDALTTDADIFAVFEKTETSVTFNRPENGRLLVFAGATPITSGTVLPVGTQLTIAAVPNQYYTLDSLTANGKALLGDTYTVSDFRSNHIEAHFAPSEARVSWTQSSGGAVSVTDAGGNPLTNGAYVPLGETITVTATPNSADNPLQSLTLNGSPFASGGQYKVMGHVDIAASFQSGGGGGGGGGGGTTIIDPLTPLDDLLGSVYSVDVKITGKGAVSLTADGNPITPGTPLPIKTVLVITANPDISSSLGTLLVNGVAFQNGGRYELYANTEILVTFVDTIPYYLDARGSKVFLGFSFERNNNGIWDAAEYIAPTGKTVDFASNTKSFTDTLGHWGEGYIGFVTNRELFLGTSATEFSPNGELSRAMFATVIGRLYERSFGEIAPVTGRTFTDCDYGAYYGKYVDWAAKNAIIEGFGNGTFGPNQSITREQMAAILYRFAQFMDAVPATLDENLDATDQGSISSWAREAVLFCQTTKLVNGMGDGRFAPQATATRAEAAGILTRFVSYIIIQAN